MSAAPDIMDDPDVGWRVTYTRGEPPDDTAPPRGEWCGPWEQMDTVSDCGVALAVFWKRPYRPWRPEDHSGCSLLHRVRA